MYWAEDSALVAMVKITGETLQNHEIFVGGSNHLVLSGTWLTT